LSTKNPIWTDPGLRGERQATNRLSHGTAFGTQLPTVLSIVRVMQHSSLHARLTYLSLNWRRMLQVRPKLQ
jgi:hypothetical protein